MKRNVGSTEKIRFLTVPLYAGFNDLRLESDFLTVVMVLVVIEHRFYVTSKRLLCFKSTFLVIIIIVIKVIISGGGGISSPKIYFSKSIILSN